MARDARYRLRVPGVSVESFEGESIVIDFGSGCYYSLSSSASLMLSLLASGASEAEVLALFATRHPEVRARLGADLDGLLERLLGERILVAHEGAPPAGDLAGAGPGLADVPPPAYLPPNLERFEDMREMLLLDPIHELDQAAWSTSRASGAEPGPA